jgi:hypothetical protein
MVNKVSLFIVSVIVCISVLPLPVAEASHLNKNQIISADDALYNATNIEAADIQSYLSSTGTQLANYTIPVEYEVYYPVAQNQWATVTVRQEWTDANETYYGLTFAELVAYWSKTSKASRPSSSGSPGQISPIVALATLDKESASITSSYRTDILSRQITMSWLMGYGFNDSMNSCITSGNSCDPDAFRQRAIWYGGPGIQVVEGISALKRWSNSPSVYNSSAFCDSGNWRTIRINGECLSLENSISYALYRYTPNFSGNELFLNLFTTIQNNFPYPQGQNDIANYHLRTYLSLVSIDGPKARDSRVWLGNTLIANDGDTRWKLDFNPEVRDNVWTLSYKDTNGTTLATKQVRVSRHRFADINGDTKVDIQDLSILANSWGRINPSDPMVNLNPSVDNEVNILDLSLLANNWEG